MQGINSLVSGCASQFEICFCFCCSVRLPFSFINKEVSKATCLCLLEEASHAEMVSLKHVTMVLVYVHCVLQPCV